MTISYFPLFNLLMPILFDGMAPIETRQLQHLILSVLDNNLMRGLVTKYTEKTFVFENCLQVNAPVLGLAGPGGGL